MPILYDNLEQKATVMGQCWHCAQMQGEKMEKSCENNRAFYEKFTIRSHFGAG